MAVRKTLSESLGRRDELSPAQIEKFVDVASGAIKGQRVAVWGLTYKPGTDTLRRSSAIELCEWLLGEGAAVSAHDPAVKLLPPGLSERLQLSATPLSAANGAAALVIEAHNGTVAIRSRTAAAASVSTDSGGATAEGRATGTSVSLSLPAAP